MSDLYHIDEEKLNGYLDGLLAPDESFQLEVHLEQCLQCSERLAELRFVFEALKAYPETEPERDLQPDILKALVSYKKPDVGSTQRQRAPSRWPYSAWLVIIAQGLVAGILSAVMIPIILGRIPQSMIQQLAGQAEQGLFLAFQNRLVEWSRVWHSLRPSFGTFDLAWDQGLHLLELFPVSTSKVFTVVAAITLLWLLANRLLLWKRKTGNYLPILM